LLQENLFWVVIRGENGLRGRVFDSGIGSREMFRLEDATIQRLSVDNALFPIYIVYFYSYSPRMSTACGAGETDEYSCNAAVHPNDYDGNVSIQAADQAIPFGIVTKAQSRPRDWSTEVGSVTRTTNYSKAGKLQKSDTRR
jgi:hypothetical protein